MTTTSRIHDSRPASRTAVMPVGVGALVAAVAMMALTATEPRDFMVLVPVVVAVTVVVFGLVVPRALRAGRTGTAAVALSFLGLLLLLPAFWSGLPLVLGAAGVLLGNAGRVSRAGSTADVVGLVVGAITVAGVVVVHVLDLLNRAGVSGA